MLPKVFCWSKYGAEAGEDVSRIIRRKDRERELNGGIFLWGIGNSIRPSLEILVRECVRPQVLFTPMLSRPARIDVAPPEVATWCSAVGIDGLPYKLPPFSAVTSRFSGSTRGSRHFALVCRSVDALVDSPAISCGFGAGDVRNLLTNNVVGASQVTSVVRSSAMGETGSRKYDVRFRADLVYPYMVTLGSPVPVPEELRSPTVARDSEVATWLDRMRHLRGEASCEPALQLF